VASVPRVEDTVQQAPFVFVATVMKLGAATVPNFEVRAGTVVVKVTRVLQTPKVVGDLTGNEITVQLADPQGMKVGDEAIFFARGVVYAESIVVQEVAPRQKITAPSRAAQVAHVTDAVGRLPDLQVQTHAAGVDLVIVGKVISVNLATGKARGPVTHHDPAWQEAVVEVESVEVGTLKQRTVAFLFPSSEDVKWYRAPKFSVGMEGVFLLHRQQVAELNQESYVVLDPLDFHPRGRVEAIRKVLKKSPKPRAPKKNLK
jgi:hypothetical protein